MKNKNIADVDSWIKNRTSHQIKALEKASKVFDENDSLSVNMLEAIYGKETSFGFKDFLGRKGSSKPAGHFQQKKDSAIEQGLKIGIENDERFDIDQSSISAAKQLKQIDNIFRKGSKIIDNFYAIAVLDSFERINFTLAAYNNGQTRIAKAQNLAKKESKDPTKWQDVKNYLEAAGATKEQIKEVLDYVELVIAYEKEFEKKSQANKKLKDKKPAKISNENLKNGHWITLDNGNKVLVGDKKAA